MPYYSCAVCFDPLPNSQRHTCGTKRCLDTWKEWGKFSPDKRRSQKNLSTLSPSERAFALSQGPSLEELQAGEEQRAILDAEVAELQSQQLKKADAGYLPKSLREALIANAPIRKEDPDETNELSAQAPETPGGSDQAE